MSEQRTTLAQRIGHILDIVLEFADPRAVNEELADAAKIITGQADSNKKYLVPRTEEQIRLGQLGHK